MFTIIVPMRVTVAVVVSLALGGVVIISLSGQVDNVDRDTNRLEGQGCDFQLARANERSDLSPECRDQYNPSQSSGTNGPSEERVAEIEGSLQDALIELEDGG